MKIKKVSTWKENLGLTRPYTIAYERVEVVENLFVLIEAENGLVGIGAGSPDEHVTGENIQACEEVLNLDGSLHLARDLVQGGFELNNGWLRTTDRPGLGVSRI